MVFPNCQGNLDFFPHQTEAMPICTVSNVLIKQISIEWALKTVRGFSKWVSWLKKRPWEETYHKTFLTCSSVYRDSHNYPEGEKEFLPYRKITPKGYQWVFSRNLIDEERVVWYNQSAKRRNKNLPTKDTLPILKLSFRNEVEIKNFQNKQNWRNSLLILPYKKCYKKFFKLRRNETSNLKMWKNKTHW